MQTTLLNMSADKLAEDSQAGIRHLQHQARKLALLSVLLGLSSCTTPPPALLEMEENVTATTHSFPTAVDNQAISSDGLGLYDTQDEPLIGNGAGDLVLLIAETSDKLLRKRSFLLDLSLKDHEGGLNDLTGNEILQQRHAFHLSHPELTRFIQQSRSPNDLRWQVFGIMNHVQGSISNNDLDLTNLGLISTEKHDKSRRITPRQLHYSRAIRADLITNNNLYGIESNQSLLSMVGEPSAFDPALHSHLANGNPSMATINKALPLTFYQTLFHPQNTESQDAFTIQRRVLGKFQLHYRSNRQAVLSFHPPTHD